MQRPCRRVEPESGLLPMNTYDPIGQLKTATGKESGGSARLHEKLDHVYDAAGTTTSEATSVTVIQERDANNIPKITYTRGTDLSGTMEGAGGIGGLLARTENSAHAHVLYHADGNGNITALASTNGILLGRYHYDPFGNILSIIGAAAEANLYRFSSKEYHPNSGLVYYLYRYYDPNLQRWPSRDPLLERGHFVLRNRHFVPLGTKEKKLYTYVRNSPVDLVDALGLTENPWPANGVVCNGCVDGSDVYILVEGKYYTLPAGECTASQPGYGRSTDVDGVWVCPPVGDCAYYRVKPGPTPFIACGRPPRRCPKWDGDPNNKKTSPKRGSGAPHNNPPVRNPPPPKYRGPVLPSPLP